MRRQQYDSETENFFLWQKTANLYTGRAASIVCHLSAVPSSIAAAQACMCFVRHCERKIHAHGDTINGPLTRHSMGYNVLVQLGVSLPQMLPRWEDRP